MGMKKPSQKMKSAGNIKRNADTAQALKNQSSDKLLTQMTSLTKDQLKSELKKRGLKITGTKSELVGLFSPLT